MTTSLPSAVRDRAAVYRALGDERRLAIVDALHHSDHAVGALAEVTGLSTNLLAFHLRVLEEAGVVERTPSQGDARRRYVSLKDSPLPLLGEPPPFGGSVEHVLFVCTANSARSQLAAHLWQARTGRAPLSAGTRPAARVHPAAIAVGRRHGLDLDTARPTDFRELDARPDLIVSVCDRAHERASIDGAPRIHWSIPDPVGRGRAAFESTFTTLSSRIDRLAHAVGAA